MFSSAFLFLLFVFSVLTFVDGADPPRRGTRAWVDIVINGSKGDAHYAHVSREHVEVCAEFASAHALRGFLTSRQIKSACQFVCYDLVAPVDCARKRDGLGGDDGEVFSLTEVIGLAGIVLQDWAETQDSLVDDEVIATWMEILIRLWPLLLALIPVMLQQYKYYNFWVAIFFNVCFFLMMVIIDITMRQRIFVMLTSVVCLTNSGPYGVVIEVAGSTAVLAGFVCVSFLTDVLTQVLLAIGIILLYCAWMVQTFAIRRPGTVPGLLVMLSAILVMHEQILLIRSGYHLYSFNMDVFEMVLSSIIPSGESRFYSKNLMRLAAYGADRLCKLDAELCPHKVFLFIFFSVAQMLCSLAFRACLGMFVMLSMRYKYTPHNLVVGYVVCMSDVFGGISYLLSGIFGVQRWDQRRMSYSILNCGILYFEINYGFDIFCMRLFFWFADSFIFMTNYNKMPKYLKVDMCDSEFPQQGSLPFLAISKVHDLASKVVIIKAEDDNRKIYKGLGFLRSDGRRVFLMSVNHVLRGFKKVVFRDRVIVDPTPTNVGYVGDDDVHHDPVAMLDVSDGAGHKGAKVDLLSHSEVKSVNTLLFFKCGYDGDPQITYVPKFSFDEYGNIRAAVDLDHGDSGGPVFALLDNNALRYAGCVSAGDSGTLSGNWISSVAVAKDDVKPGWLDSDEGSLDSDRGKRVTFNSVLECSDVDTRLNMLNRKAQSLHDKLVGVWFVDESREGDDVVRFQKYSDVVDYINRQGTEGFKKDSEWFKKKGKNRTVDYVAAKEDVFRNLRKLYSVAHKTLGERLGDDFCRDVRCGYLPSAKRVGVNVVYTPLSSGTAPLSSFDPYSEATID